MKHLSERDIIGFITVKSIGEESAGLVEKVNRHVMECAECAERVKRAARYQCAVESMSAEGFRSSDIAVCEYDIPAYQVAEEVKKKASEKKQVRH